MSARGQVGKTLVAFVWKGLNVMRSHVVPANPNTAAQATHRTLWTDCVYVWRNTFTNTAMRTAWNLAALTSSLAESGFNAAMRAMVKICASNADASFALSAAAGAAYIVNFTMKNADDGATGDEAGNFEVWSGTAPGSLLNVGNATIAAGVAATPALGAAGGVRYVQLIKDSQPRSGICKITIAA
jgi:hypothetical protein